ncbi:hypothetical protein MRX96_040471 [Rhipicephalus microplus]
MTGTSAVALSRGGPLARGGVSPPPGVRASTGATVSTAPSSRERRSGSAWRGARETWRPGDRPVVAVHVPAGPQLPTTSSAVMSSSTAALLPQRSSSSRRELATVRAPPILLAASYSRSKHGLLPTSTGAYCGGYPAGGAAGVVPVVAGSTSAGHTVAMARRGGPFPPLTASRAFADPRWVHTEPVEPKQRPILSAHGYYMCIAVSIVVAIGLVVAFGFFVMQRRFAQAVVNK